MSHFHMLNNTIRWTIILQIRDSNLKRTTMNLIEHTFIQVGRLGNNTNRGLHTKLFIIPIILFSGKSSFCFLIYTSNLIFFFSLILSLFMFLVKQNIRSSYLWTQLRRQRNRDIFKIHWSDWHLSKNIFIYTRR